MIQHLKRLSGKHHSHTHTSLDCLHIFKKIMSLSLSTNYIYSMTLRGRITDRQEYNARGTAPDQRL